MALDIGDDTDERRANAVSLIDPDLHGMLQVKEVPLLIQARLSVARVRTMSRLSTVADDRGSVGNFCHDTLNMNLVNDIVDVAAVVDAWESSQVRMTARNKAEAEASISSQPRAVNKVELQDLIQKYETLHGTKLEDKFTPAAVALEQVFEQVENGEFKNMALVQFVSREDAEAEVLGATIEKGTGTLKVKRGFGECQKPRTPEEFRSRMQVVANSYLLAQLKYPQKAALKELQPVHFLRYLDLMLGDHVLGLKAKDKDGNTIATPEFSLMLSYDYQIRRQMVKLVNSGQSMSVALKAAMLDTTIKERYFITPNVYSQVASAYGHGSGGTGSTETPRSRTPDPRAEGAWKAKGKGKGPSKKGGGPKGKQRNYMGHQLHDRAPDGRQICWKWNSPTDRCRFQCGRLHACQICFSNHPYHSCPKVRGKDTAGQGDGQSTEKWQPRSGGAAPAPPTKEHNRSNHCMRILYLFSGGQRKTSVAAVLRQLLPGACIDEVDILISQDHDMSQREHREDVLTRLKAGYYDAVLVTPAAHGAEWGGQTFEALQWSVARSMHGASHGYPKPTRRMQSSAMSWSSSCWMFWKFCSSILYQHEVF